MRKQSNFLTAIRKQTSFSKEVYEFCEERREEPQNISSLLRYEERKNGAGQMYRREATMTEREAVSLRSKRKLQMKSNLRAN